MTRAAATKVSEAAASSNATTNSQFEIILEKLAALESLPAKIASLEQLLMESNAKVATLQSELDSKDKTIATLTAKTNDLEQYNRGWSIRITNVQLPDGDATDTRTVMRTVYEKALLPILHGALEKDLIDHIPEFDDVLENAHILPAKSSSRPKPIIARFYSRPLRSILFQLKKEYAPKKDITTPSGERKTAYVYPFYEDLTKDAFQLLQALLKDPRTGPVWSVGGRIRYKLKDSSVVKKVTSIFDSVDDILGK
jgi:uncharacterized coiled-coil protein SlyX